MTTTTLGGPPPSILSPYINAKSKNKDGPMKIQMFRGKKAKVLSTDTNDDGRADIFDYFSSEGALIERKEDRNFDSKIDKVSLLPRRSGDKLKIESDENFDGIFERVEERWSEGDYIVIHIKIDTKSKGVFDFEIKDRVKREKALAIDSKDSDCVGTIEQLKNIRGLSKLFSNIAAIGPLSGDFYSTSFGYEIQKACVEQLGANDITNLVSDALKKGLACQWQLGTPQSKTNVHKMASLMLDEKNPPKIICDEDNYDWGMSMFAHGTTPGDKNHPFISFNPTKIKERGFGKLSATFFHETMHNIGYLHEADIEFPYVCTSCCFDTSTQKAHDLACQICKGQYSGPMDKKYITDVTDFFLLDERVERSMGILLNYLKANPKDRWAQFKLATANRSDLSSPLAVAFAQTLKSRYSSMSSDEKSEIEKTERLGESSYVKLFSEPTRAVAESLLKVFDGDLSGAEVELKKIRIPPRERDPSVDQFDYDYMKKTINDLKRDIAWKIYYQHEALGNTAARNRVFDDFLDSKRR